MNAPRYSIIVPLYNRPKEIEELLGSMTRMIPAAPYEVIVVEDGSTLPSREIVEGYIGRLDIRYIVQKNQGPAGARNAGAAVARGEVFIFIDSDTLLPEGYLMAVEAESAQDPVPLWGGPDRAAEDFTTIQKAINYSMTSFFTTGGIRGGRKRLDRFYPRSFNMGVSRSVFERVGGFGALRFGEDMDFSMRVLEAGYRSACYREAWLYHKRRVSWRQFFRQVHNSGIARITLQRLHPGSLKAVHFFPTLFLLGNFLLLMLTLLWHTYCLLPLLLYALLIVTDLYIREGSMHTALCGVVAAYVQLMGYGSGFLLSFVRQNLLGQDNFTRYEKTFYD